MSAIYTEYFGFGEPPFSLAPDPRYLYASEQHREALAHLLYGVRGEGGFVLLTGEVGTGKTTIFRCLMERLPERTSIAFVLHPRLSVPELLATVCDEFRIAYPAGTESTKTFVDLLYAYLLDITRKGSHAVLVIDEAQSLSVEVLEQLRLLTNLETNRRKLLQIILLGQPELREMLARPDMTQFSQRITARYHLGPLPRSDTGPYIEHRLAVAGVQRPLFPRWAVGRIHRLSGGVPRVINLICDRALLGTFTSGKTAVTRPIVEQAAAEVLGSGGRAGKVRRSVFIGAAAALCLAIFGLYGLRGEDPPVREETVAEANAVPAQTVPEAPEVREVQETPEVQKVQEAPEAPEVPQTPAPAAAPENGEDERVAARVERSRDLGWLFGQSREGAREHAAEILFAAWDLSPSAGWEKDECAALHDEGLRCLSSNGGLDDLRRLNRPAVLRLLDAGGSAFYAALTAADEERVTLVFKGGSGEVEFRWLGSYTLFWKPPPGYAKPLVPGQRSPVTGWVRASLGGPGSDQPAGEAELYDPELVEAVRRFQTSQGLEADGIVGPRTLIHLNSRKNEEVPLLMPVKGEG
jgi:general secretion pathway protein A